MTNIGGKRRWGIWWEVPNCLYFIRGRKREGGREGRGEGDWDCDCLKRINHDIGAITIKWENPEKIKAGLLTAVSSGMGLSGKRRRYISFCALFTIGYFPLTHMHVFFFPPNIIILLNELDSTWCCLLLSFQTCSMSFLALDEISGRCQNFSSPSLTSTVSYQSFTF